MLAGNSKTMMCFCWHGVASTAGMSQPLSLINQLDMLHEAANTPVISIRIVEASEQLCLTAVCSISQTACFRLFCQLALKPECTAATAASPQPTLADSPGKCGTSHACSLAKTVKL